MTDQCQQVSFYKSGVRLSFRLGLLLVFAFSTSHVLLSLSPHVKNNDQWQKAMGTSNLQIRAIVGSRTDPMTLYAASFGSAVLNSTDNRESWSQFDRPGLGTNDVYTIELCGEAKLFAGTWGQGVRRFNLGSDTSWQPKNNGITSSLITTIVCDPRNSNIIYTGTTDKGIFRSNDNGDSWIETNNNLSDKRVLAAKIIDSYLFVGTLNGIFFSNDQGANWQNAGVDNLSGKSIYTILYVENTVWIGTNAGIYRSPLNSISWSRIDNNFDQTVYALAVDPNGRVSAGTKDNKVFRYSEERWSSFSTDLRASRIYWLLFSTMNPNRLYAGTNDGIWYNTVEPVPAPLPTATPGISRITLEKYPLGEIQPGQFLSYTVRYQKTISNTIPLEDIRITNTIPINADYIDIVDKSADINCPPKESVIGKQFVCTSNRLADSNSRFITYQVQRPALAPTPTPEFMEIIKTGPLTATANVPFTYTFWITSHSNMTITDLVITDIIPSGIIPINVAVDSSRIATFPLTETLEAGATISKTFQVLAEQTVTNSNYGVKATMNQQEETMVSTRGYKAVTTYIGESPPIFVVFNQGAEISWIYLDESNTVKKQRKISNSTLNFNPTQLIYLPVIQQ